MSEYLFPLSPNTNLLPTQGEVYYFGKILTAEESKDYYESFLNEIEWKNDLVILYGKRIVTKRKVAWYGDSDFEYTYSGSSKKALPWTSKLLFLKHKIETLAKDRFNSCLLNLYPSGEEGMAWHSDDEDSLKKKGKILSLSLGAERRFLFRHKNSKETVAIHLESGSLLSMEGDTQEFWNHSLPKMTRVKTPRINLTFRCFEL